MEIVINSLWKSDMFHFAFGHLVKDIMSYVSSFQNFFSHSLEQGIAAVHTLATRAIFFFFLLLI